MKKRFIVLLMASLLCLAGCNTGGGASSSSDSSSSSAPGGPLEYQEITAPYTAEDLETVTFKDVAKDLTIDVSEYAFKNAFDGR